MTSARAAPVPINMYRHILIPTDGSPLSEDAARTAIGLARSLGARLTALHVVPEPATPALEGWSHHDRDFDRHLADTLERHGAHYVETIREHARLAGVPCDGVLCRAKVTEREILLQAESRGCDLIVMASHGRKGPDGLLLASVTVAVATLGHTPVLIHHRPQPATMVSRSATLAQPDPVPH